MRQVQEGLHPLDPVCPIDQQLRSTADAVVLANLFSAAESGNPALLSAWEKDALWMTQQPGFLSTQLHRAIGGSHMFTNDAVWASVEHFRAAFTHPNVVGALAAYPSSAVAQPHLFAKVAVPNLCAARAPGRRHVARAERHVVAQPSPHAT